MKRNALLFFGVGRFFSVDLNGKEMVEIHSHHRMKGGFWTNYQLLDNTKTSCLYIFWYSLPALHDWEKKWERRKSFFVKTVSFVLKCYNSIQASTLTGMMSYLRERIPHTQKPFRWQFWVLHIRSNFRGAVVTRCFGKLWRLEKCVWYFC